MTKSKSGGGRKKGNISQQVKLAFLLFMNTDMSQEEICETAGISSGTFTKYKKQEDWPTLKTAERLAGPRLVKDLYRHIQKIIDAADDKKVPMTPAEADSIFKLRSMIDSLTKQPDMSERVKILKDFTKWMALRYPKKAESFYDLMTEYLREISHG